MKRGGTVLLLILAVLPVFSPAGTSAREKTPLMGWSSWNAFRVNISDSTIMNQARMLTELGLRDCGYRYVNIDDGFFGYRDGNGTMVPHSTRFPSGLKPVVDYIHSCGLKAGIYTDAGTETCGSMYDGDINGKTGGMFGHDRQDIDLYFNKWDFDYIKIDYCGAQKLGLDEEQRYSEIYRNIHRYARKDSIRINICRWAFPGTWASGAGDSWRISGDIRQRWSSIASIIRKNLYLSAFASDGHFNDMDILVIGFADRTAPIGGETLTYTEEEAHFGMWCIMSSPLVLGCDLRYIPQAALDLISNPELISVNQDPLGLQAYVVQNNGTGYVLAKDLLEKRGNTRAVALYNPSDSACAFTVPLSAIEFDEKVRVRDLSRRTDLGKVKGCIRMTLPAHSARILKVEGKKRTDPVLYEAEWGYLPMFDDIGRAFPGIRHKENPAASGGMTVSRSGSGKENCIEWKDVYSSSGGSCIMEISYAAVQDSGNGSGGDIMVSINGREYTAPVRDDSSAGSMQKISLHVNLDKGYNTVRFWNDSKWLPDIDCFTIVPVK